MRYETVQVKNFAGYFVFCGLDMSGDNDGGVDLLSGRFLDILGKSKSFYQKVAIDVVAKIKSDLTKFDYYVFRLSEENYVFFDSLNKEKVLEDAPIIAEKIAKSEVLYSANFEFRNHMKILKLIS